mmetsp:Transcript_26684/g.40926  ORF Transcript_26684/g.40926 Transcript_26684/m.40926 type:complete len:160 (+) Transcript_26684:28-507(+)
MGNTAPARPAVPAGKTRICISGFGISHNVSRAQQVADIIASTYPDKYETWYYFSTPGFRALLKEIKAELPEREMGKESTTDKGTTVATHHSAPFVWFEQAAGNGNDGKTYNVKGGRDLFCAWAVKEFPNDTKIQELAGTGPSLTEVVFNSNAKGTCASL